MTRFGATLPRAGALAAALCLSTAALAADLPSRVAPPLVPVLPAPVFSWTGFYVGGSAGADIMSNNWNTNAFNLAVPFAFPADNSSAVSFSRSRARLGGYVGYNYQIDQVVVGIEGDAAYDFGGSRSVSYLPGALFTLSGGVVPSGDSVTASSRWDASIRGRVGYAVQPTLLVYATGGAAFRDARYTAACAGFANVATSACGAQEFDSFSNTRVGWTAGGGVEWAFTPNLLARVEYRYSDFGTRSLTYFNPGNNFGADAFNASTRLSASTVTVGLAYKFGAPPIAAPVVARY